MKAKLFPLLVPVAAALLLASCGHVHHLPRQHRAAVGEPHLTIRTGEERRVLSDAPLARATSQLSPSVPLGPQSFLRVSDKDILALDTDRGGAAVVRGLRPGVADVHYRDDDKITRIRVGAEPSERP